MHLIIYIGTCTKIMTDGQPCGLEIKPRQSIAIFGLWDQPRRVLEWPDITSRNLTWSTLRTQIGLTSQQLMRIQPNPVEWVNRASIKLHDLPDMTCFPVNPFTHLHADLAEVWNMQWTADTLKQFNVTYDQLRVRGMTPTVMRHFSFTLSQWMNLGFNEDHANHIDDESIKGLFDMHRDEVIDIIQNYKL
jgi:hypothetical protein